LTATVILRQNIYGMNRWADYYTKKAKEQNWLARSVFKLQEIDKKTKLIRTAANVLDLGCYPGSWSQYSLKKVGKKGRVIGIDILEPDRLSSENFYFIKADVLKLDTEKLKQEIGIQDVVLSDMAPKTTGIVITDVARSLELAYKALEIALSVLRSGGNFLCKVFEGSGFEQFKKEVSLSFKKTRLIRPVSTRKKSREVFIVGIYKKD